MDPIREKYGGYGEIFKGLLGAAADALNQPDIISSKKGLEMSAYDVVHKQDYPDLENIDAVLMTGSSASSHNTSNNTDSDFIQNTTRSTTILGY